MSVKEVLNKLTEHNAGVIGCMATRSGQLHHNLKDAYALIDMSMIAEEAEMMFTLLDDLDEPPTDAQHVFLEMPGHSVFAKRLDDGVLVVLNRPIDRRVFKQMQVGVNLFVKPLSRALASDEAEPSAEAAAPKPGKKRRFYRGVEY
ncbi:MAG: hypothetical protein AAF367_09640 [Pseudomonadota bacterium]